MLVLSSATTARNAGRVTSVLVRTAGDLLLATNDFAVDDHDNFSDVRFFVDRVDAAGVPLGGFQTDALGGLILGEAPDGRIFELIATSSALPLRIEVLLPDGTPDLSYGVLGEAAFDLGSGVLTDAAIDAHGRVVLLWMNDTADHTHTYAFVTRLDAAGNLDASFGSGGSTQLVPDIVDGVTGGPPGAVFAMGVFVQKNSKILVVGSLDSFEWLTAR